MKMRFSYDDLCSTLDYLQKAYADNHDFVVFPAGKPQYNGYEIDCYQTYFSARKRADADGMEIGELYPLMKAMVNTLNKQKDQSEGMVIEYEPKNKLIMQEENIEFLRNNVKYSGFGEQVADDMVAQINMGNPEFNLATTSIYWDKTVEYTLHFKQSETSGRYFFNRFDARLSDGDHSRQQTFYIKNGKGVTAKEAYNLLDGRYVHKEMLNQKNERYNAHLRLDFDNKDDKGNYKYVRYSEAYGYRLEDTLAKVPIREMEDPKVAEQLLNSLDRGNLQMVTIDTGEHLGRYYITPDPVKGLNIFDEKFRPVEHRDLGLNLRFKRNQSESEKQANVKSRSEKQSQKQDAPKEKSGKRQSQRQKAKVA